MEQPADIFLLSRGTWHSECDLLLHIFALLECAGDWAACAKVCRMWRRLVPLARPYGLREGEVDRQHTAWLERHSAMLSRLHTCTFGDMEGIGVRGRRRHMRLVFDSAPLLRRVFFKTQTDWHMDGDLPVFDSLSPSVRTVYGGVLRRKDWTVMHPEVQLTRCFVPGEVMPSALVHLRGAIFLKCNMMDPITIVMLPACNKELLTLEIFLVPEKHCMRLAHLPKLQHLRIGQGKEGEINLNSFPALLSFSFQGEFERCIAPPAEEFTCEPSSIRWVREKYTLSSSQKVTLFAYSGRTDLSRQMTDTLDASDHMHDFNHPMYEMKP